MTLTPQAASRQLRDICGHAPVIPVLVIGDVAQALPLAKALVSGGLPVLEVTMRTPAALDAIRAMATIPGSIVGAGTLRTADDVEAAQEAGARFGVSPGATDHLLEACERHGLPLMPGATTASEIMRLNERGYDLLKFFPAGPSGGVPVLEALAGPLPDIAFCPTGGIGPENAASYLALRNVACVGGSWVAPRAVVEAGDWPEIEALARAAAALGGAE